MHQIKQAHKNIIVFSQWSRKSYAVFASLRKLICIARLSIDLCSSSLFKVPAIVRLLSLLGISDVDDDTSISEQLENLLLSLEILPKISSNTDIYALNKFTNYNTRNPYFAQCKVWVFSF